ncbi:tetratricopeptide repeat protein [Paenibacillus larvae]|uniref:Uncharacterized protein n=5 Tax=Paenibacillus larvae TaxID=1464 RepID=V9W4Y6_9BACL|nr:tetratricopeptide repeat protein [Paenibacillus larvae]AHD05218.1 hypothetical protein ERIC2_c13920 [Paenibacillus larvae subsp. larvae DSM 25430]AQR79462.1 hypothetical protein BXP28_21815 [Paenibacillus larvae subsp. larvae]AQZ47911.1 hypothetical protein B5S25_16270 [Paenibacillus larvae subsp. pulvifaciens]ARF66991.1 hypothetical protein B7C51_02995 [Paenibacillus larvae subsp. pulvifaciens]AVF23354.1 putative PEP-CTERM system TPR-repeat lipoprotein [Paenibacillus larvae subsp. larvae]
MNGEQEIQKAYQALLDNDFEQAIDCFEQAVRRDPLNADFHYKLSISCARSGKLKKALAHARDALRLAPNDEVYLLHSRNLKAKSLMQQAGKFLKEGKNEQHKAIRLLKEAVILDPLFFEAFILLSVSYDDLEDYTMALKSVHEALKLNPADETAQTLRAEYENKLKAFLHR